MGLLKKENGIVCLLLNLIAPLIFPLAIASYMDIYEQGAWYTKWYYWVIGACALISPGLIMALVFIIMINAKVAEKLEVPGSEIYASPYSYILCMVVPFVGWTLLIVMLIYIYVFTIVSLLEGKGEKYVRS